MCTVTSIACVHCLTQVVNAFAKVTTPATLVVLSNLTGSVPLFANEVISKSEAVIGGTLGVDGIFDVHVMWPWLSVDCK